MAASLTSVEAEEQEAETRESVVLCHVGVGRNDVHRGVDIPEQYKRHLFYPWEIRRPDDSPSHKSEDDLVPHQLPERHGA